jgi:hypothetical protein
MNIQEASKMVEGEQVVKELTEAFAAKQPEPSVEDMAAYDYQRLIPEFYKQIEELNKRSLKKVIIALIEYPLESQQFRWSYPGEKEAFNIGMRIFDSKYVIMKAVFEMKREEINKLLLETSKAEDVGTLEAKQEETK